MFTITLIKVNTITFHIFHVGKIICFVINVTQAIVKYVNANWIQNSYNYTKCIKIL